MRIDNEFKNLIPALTDEEYKGLEQSILSEGCRDALVLWGDILVDGHNRYEICTKHGIEYKTVQKEFGSRDDVKLWMIGNQLARRNINKYARTTLESVSDEIQSRRNAVREKEHERKTTFVKSQKSNLPTFDTTKDIAKKANVGEQTASRVITINKKIDRAIAEKKKIAGQKPEQLKKKLMDGDVSINKAYK